MMMKMFENHHLLEENKNTHKKTLVRLVHVQANLKT